MVFDLIDERKWYDLLLQRPRQFVAFVQRLIEHDSIDNLLEMTLKAGKKDKARELVERFYQHWPDKKPNDSAGDLVEVAFDAISLILNSSFISLTVVANIRRNNKVCFDGK